MQAVQGLAFDQTNTAHCLLRVREQESDLPVDPVWPEYVSRIVAATRSWCVLAQQRCACPRFESSDSGLITAYYFHRTASDRRIDVSEYPSYGPSSYTTRTRLAIAPVPSSFGAPRAHRRPAVWNSESIGALRAPLTAGLVFVSPGQSRGRRHCRSRLGARASAHSCGVGA
jgi:hypothetical protein